MKTYHEVVMEAERILSLLKECIPVFRHLKNVSDKFMDQWKLAAAIKLPDAGLSNPHPIFKEMRYEYADILHKEKNINPKYSEFSNDLDEAKKCFEHVRDTMIQFENLGPGGVSLRSLEHHEVVHLHALFTEDEKFVEFRQINVAGLVVRWDSLNLFEELKEYVTRMKMLRKEMLAKLHSVGINSNYN
ncbi:unnamed protein product [Orchesella dallaii]|uniref:Uncharacterized protein n=1 Tax=Orchesella dallaii TaxID=48710 RepID=A0ABP1R4T2_9HEXA